MAGYNGADNAHLRYMNLSQTAAQLKVEEDTSHDPDLIHTPESVGYFAIGGSGLLFAVAHTL